MEPPERRRTAARVRALAKPPVRKLAKDLGISLVQLAGTGPGGSITRDDVHRAASDTGARSENMVFGNGSRAATGVADLSHGGEERIPVKGVRKHMAAAMVSSAFTAPHVTEFLQVDVTETMAAVRRVRELPEFADVRVSPLLFVARALLVAVARHPLINSSWDAGAQEIVVKHYVNLGIAVAATRGLLVPNVKNAGALPLPELARRLQALTETARAGQATPADLAGGTITITNVGVFGVDAGTPILSPGEAAILAFGQVKETPWVVGGQLAVRQACTLSLSFDHRIVDGELGSAVLRDVGAMLEDPVRTARLELRRYLQAMIRHVVMFRWTPEATQEQKQRVAAELRRLPALLPVLRGLSRRSRSRPAEGNFEFAVVADFDDLEGLRTYRDNPEHRAIIAEFIQPIIAQRAAVQYEF